MKYHLLSTPFPLRRRLLLLPALQVLDKVLQNLFQPFIPPGQQHDIFRRDGTSTGMTRKGFEICCYVF